jgi:hypothetical protein
LGAHGFDDSVQIYGVKVSPPKIVDGSLRRPRRNRRAQNVEDQSYDDFDVEGELQSRLREDQFSLIVSRVLWFEWATR